MDLLDAADEWSLLLSFSQALATAAIAIVGALHTAAQRREQALAQRRSLIREASGEADLCFAQDFFVCRMYRDSDGVHVLQEGDFASILNAKVLFPPTAWHRAARSKLMIFLESIRPSAHLLGGGGPVDCLAGPYDPCVARIRLAMQAMATFWSPQPPLKSPCTDAHRNFIRDSYGGGEEWELVLAMLHHIRLSGRLDHADAPPVRAQGGAAAGGATTMV
ncbi:hypothetical protein EMIHUDRAFT_357469 [Emiliania huxleyi CCMP1516]|uniref:Uncharacterized protein n=2 Tax=Emiliania huxleyi TaxID=2903 RepID=A0A0D3ILE0_EMIH1|nr:hypothetical protein EMIHUDRAFT_357469 [Emiliania huxleyi CCMP1516]EOD12075.1 hypothetical protein EMIHUDRAFT_357469 [Emiliania huxleyi CCMP1516]|eukprot:XP_005764504.1 hypothetical protein EMIHUDRAFT_357469 [Emiliania huxleyi CCMP1516]